MKLAYGGGVVTGIWDKLYFFRKHGWAGWNSVTGEKEESEKPFLIVCIQLFPPSIAPAIITVSCVFFLSIANGCISTYPVFLSWNFYQPELHAREHRGRCHEKNEESYRHTATCCLVHMQAQTFIMKWFMNRISLWFLPSVCSRYTHRS